MRSWPASPPRPAAGPGLCRICGRAANGGLCAGILYFTAEAGFVLDEGFLRRIVPGIDLVFLCEPNNPTGRTTPRELLLQIAARCRETGALLVLDECFNDFLDQPTAHSLVRELQTNQNLLILKAFTKLYAMAGVRLGYCLCADGKLLDAMRAAGQPWPGPPAWLKRLDRRHCGKQPTCIRFKP